MDPALAILLMWLNSARPAPLVQDEVLAADAQSWAAEMDSERVLHHGLDQTAYPFDAGEIVGWGASPDAVGAAFVNSPPHRGIIERYRVVGCGRAGDFYACRFRD